MKNGCFILLGLILFLICSVTGCAGQNENGKGPIIVGSKIDAEGALLAHLIILSLREQGYNVVDKSSFGPTSVVRKALLSGEIDIYPEYTGAGAFFFDELDSPVWKDAQQGYDRVKKLDKEQNSIVWLTPAPADNTWAIAIPQNLAAKENLKSLEDFAAYVNSGGYVKLIGSEEFVIVADALPAFQEAYGFTLNNDQLITVSSGDTAYTEKAAAEGIDGINAAMAYGTDGSLKAFDMVILSDPKGVQPVYEPTPIVRGAVYEKYPEIERILAPVFESLDLVTLQMLNGKITVDGQNAGEVAKFYLEENNFIN